MRHAFLLFHFFGFCLGAYAQTQEGPGGVGNTDGSSSLKIWYRVDNGLSVTGSSVDSWTNSAGISALDVTDWF